MDELRELWRWLPAFRRRNHVLDRCEIEGRDPATIERSVNGHVLLGADPVAPREAERRIAEQCGPMATRVVGGACQGASVASRRREREGAPMSMFRVGAEASTGPGGRIKSPRTPPSDVLGGRPITGDPPPDQPTGEQSPSDVFGAAIDLLTKWIPSETIAFYAPGIVILAEGGSPPSVIWLIIMALVSPIFVLVGTFSTGKQFDVRKTVVSAVLGLGAFLVWSITIPGSGWYRWETLADNQAVVPIAAAILATVYSGVAEGIQKRVGS